MTLSRQPPEAAYGILRRNQVDTHLDEVVEQVRNLGYGVLNAGYSTLEFEKLSDAFDQTYEAYKAKHGEKELKQLNELHTVRSPLTHGGPAFLDLALNGNLLAALGKLITGKFILNQQNGVINPPRETYNQAAWHRDLPYQHFVSSTPLAINALFCLDEFTLENGATYVLPASHKAENFPSEAYIRRNAIQIQAKPGCFILLDCMLFHAGGFNSTSRPRRAVNHVYNIPYFKQQINIPRNMDIDQLSPEAREILGFNTLEPCSISEYLAGRAGKS